MIRLAQEGDWPSILEVHRAAFGKDDVRVSPPSARTGERVLQLSPLGVLPTHQRRGHGFVRADELGLLPPPEALHDWAFRLRCSIR